MKVVLFCGGFGMRLREYSDTIPKPLVTIGYRPILWYLMKYYAHYGHTDFIVCLGYRGDLIKEFFVNYDPSFSGDFALNRGRKSFDESRSDVPDWNINFLETGLHSNIGMRLMAARNYLRGEPMFLANYSDQLSDLPLPHYLEQFERSDAIAGFVSVRAPLTYHVADIDADGAVRGIQLMSEGEYWINGGFLALKQQIFDYMEYGDELVNGPFEKLIRSRRLYAYKYEGFWKAMDTFKDKLGFDHMLGSGETPWEIWRRPAEHERALFEITRASYDRTRRR
jgi:glucose-1-phosphate cytidylyltransferase